MKNFRKILKSINLNDETNYDYQKEKLSNLLNNYVNFICTNIYNLDNKNCSEFTQNTLSINIYIYIFDI